MDPDLRQPSDSTTRGGKRRLHSPPAPRSLLLAALAAIVVVTAFGRFVWPLFDAEEAMRRHDWQAALVRLDRCEWLMPGRRASHAFTRARILTRQDHLSEANAALDNAARLGHDPDRVHRQRILTTAQGGGIGTVEPELRRFLGLGLDDVFAEECYEALVKGYLACHRIDDARQCLEYWLDWQPHNARGHALVGLVMEKLERHGDALDAYRRALALEPKDVTLRGRVATLENHAGQPHKAAEILSQCLVERPDDAGFLLALADCRIRTGDFAAARDLLIDVLTLDVSPERASTALTALGAFATEERQTRDALELYRDAVQRNPRGITSRFGYAAALDRMGDEAGAAHQRSEAQRLLQQHRRLTELTREAIGEPRNADLRVEIARILLELGLTDQGTHWLGTAIQLDPRHAGARRMLEDLGNGHLLEEISEDTDHTASAGEGGNA